MNSERSIPSPKSLVVSKLKKETVPFMENYTSINPYYLDVVTSYPITLNNHTLANQLNQNLRSDHMLIG